MSLNSQNYKINRSRYHGIFTLMLLLACVFAQCTVHAANQQLMTQTQMTHMSDSEHDCCQEQQQCCEQQQALTSTGSLDLPVETLLVSFSGLTDLLHDIEHLPLAALFTSKIPTGPPVHLLNCRFTL